MKTYDELGDSFITKKEAEAPEGFQALRSQKQVTQLPAISFNGRAARLLSKRNSFGPALIPEQPSYKGLFLFLLYSKEHSTSSHYLLQIIDDRKQSYQGLRTILTLAIISLIELALPIPLHTIVILLFLSECYRAFDSRSGFFKWPSELSPMVKSAKFKDKPNQSQSKT